MTRVITAFAAIALAVGLSACNTIKGIGQDVKKTGEVIEGAAKK